MSVTEGFTLQKYLLYFVDLLGHTEEKQTLRSIPKLKLGKKILGFITHMIIV